MVPYIHSEIVYEDNTIWEYKFAFFPKTCNISNKIIWFKYGYRGRNYYRAGDIHIDYKERWHRKNEHIGWLLRK